MLVNLDLGPEVSKLVQYIPGGELNSVLVELIKEAIDTRTDLSEKGKQLSAEELLALISTSNALTKKFEKPEPEDVKSEVVEEIDVINSDFDMDDLGDLADLMK